MEISLSNLDWQVKGYWPYVPIKEKSMETGQQLHGVTPWIRAKVPGGVHYDLYQAGYITNPYFGRDSLQCEWIENRWWMYRTVFSTPHPKSKRKTELIFEGLDYEVLVYVNDLLLAKHKGMYDALHVDITEVLKEENTLVVVFKGVPQEMGQIGFTSRTFTQKSRFNYKWDFSTRLVNIGFWQDVKLKIYEEVEIQDIYVHSDVENGQGVIMIEGRVERAKESILQMQLQLYAPDSENCTHQSIINIEPNEKFEDKIIVEQPMLWYPNGSGKQPLYTLKISALAEDKNILLSIQKVGIRSLAYGHNEREHEDALPYTFMINGNKTYIKGMNVTPIDHIYGNVTKEQYAYLIDCAVNANVNMLRVWGGGLIEKEWFYNLCDEKGILIWQEFIQSSSGIDNTPSLEPDFLELLKVNSIAAIKQKRNHVSLTVWSGGNELMETENTPCGYDNQNIAMLKELVEQYDPYRMFLPTSASGPRQFLSSEKGVSHDVHGSWSYQGNPKHYQMYGNSDNLFHSEFGMDGTTSLKNLKKFLPKDSWYPTPMSGNLNWQHHGEWWGTYGRDTQFFGPIKDLSLFVQASQYMQAEGLRFIIEANRRRKYQNSGCIIWQLNEPWPNASCTNLVDYYGDAKPAYYWVKKTYAPVHVSMTYQKLDYIVGEQFSQEITLHNSQEEFVGKIICKVRNLDGTCVIQQVYDGKFSSNSCANATKFTFKIENVSEVFFVELKVIKNEQVISENVYMFALQKEHLFEPLMGIDAEVICKELSSCTNELTGEIEKTVCLKNIGKEVAIHTGVELKEDCYWCLGDDNYAFLFPQEEKTIKLKIRKKITGTFLSSENFLSDNTIMNPSLEVVWMGKSR